jgi:hypothetical protein
LKACERLLPGPKTPVSKLPSFAVAECCACPLLAQVTLSPTETVTVTGE